MIWSYPLILGNFLLGLHLHISTYIAGERSDDTTKKYGILSKPTARPVGDQIVNHRNFLSGIENAELMTTYVALKASIYRNKEPVGYV